MKVYIVEIHPYPQSFTVAAESAEEAKAKAHEKWHSVTGGQSIYQTEVELDRDLSTCIICNEPQDEDGRCKCTNEDANG